MDDSQVQRGLWIFVLGGCINLGLIFLVHMGLSPPLYGALLTVGGIALTFYHGRSSFLPGCAIFGAITSTWLYFGMMILLFLP